jgi:hypothetical protein
MQTLEIKAPPNCTTSVVKQGLVLESLSYQKTNQELKMADFRVTISDKENAVDVPLQEFHEKYSAGLINSIQPVIKKALTSLLEVRDFLGYQLDNALGNIEEEEFEEIAEQYFSKYIHCDDEQLSKDLMVLMQTSNMTFDADNISAIFRCEIDQAERVLTLLISGPDNQ